MEGIKDNNQAIQEQEPITVDETFEEYIERIDSEKDKEYDEVMQRHLEEEGYEDD